MGGRRTYKILQEQRIALTIVQRNVRKYISMKTWPWFYLWMRVKPLINQPRIEDAINELKTRSDASVAACKEAEDKAAFLENQHGQLIKEIDDLKVEVEQTAGHAAAFIENFALIASQKAELERQLQEMETQIGQETSHKNQLAMQKKLVEGDVGGVKAVLEDLEGSLQKLSNEKSNRDHQIRVLNEEMDTRKNSLPNTQKKRSNCKRLMQRMLKMLEVLKIEQIILIK